MGRWRWRQLALLTSSRGVCGRLRTPANLAGGVRDASQESRVHDAPGQLGRPLRPLGNLQRRVLTLPRPRKRSAARFGAFRGLGNVQRRVLELSEPSETFSGAFWSFPSPRKRSAACFDTFRGLGASADAGEVCLVRAFEVPGQLPCLGRGRRRLRTPAKFAWYGLLRYPTSFPASAEAGRRRSLLGTGF